MILATAEINESGGMNQAQMKVEINLSSLSATIFLSEEKYIRFIKIYRIYLNRILRFSFKLQSFIIQREFEAFKSKYFQTMKEKEKRRKTFRCYIQD